MYYQTIISKIETKPMLKPTRKNVLDYFNRIPFDYFDIDGNGKVNALTEGLLILRFLISGESPYMMKGCLS